MTRPPLLVVGWPGADWPRLHPLLDAGELPALGGMVEAGVSGPLAAVEPYLDAPLWTTLATGCRASEHGLLADAETDPETGGVRPATSLSWRTPAVWQTLADAGLRCHVIGWPATHPGSTVCWGAAMVTDSYPRPTASPDAAGTAAWPLLPRAIIADEPEIVASLAQLRVSPAEIDAELLGEFVPRWREVNPALDPRLRLLALALAETLSVHNAATFLLEVLPPEVLFVHYGLLERLAPLFLPCLPGLPGVAARHAELYGDVLPAACRWLDRFLVRLQTLAGPRAATAVVSPSGLRAPAGGLALQAATFPPTADISRWRRATGMFAVAGEEAGVPRDVLVHGVSVLDFAPVFGRLAGVLVDAGSHPSAARAMQEIFADAPAPPWVASPAKSSLSRAPSANLTPEESRAFCTQFLTTGEWAGVPPAAKVRRQSDLALARTWSQAGDDGLAQPILEALHTQAPENAEVAYGLTLCLLRLGALQATRAAAETVFDVTWATPPAELLLGHFASGERRYEEAFACFQRAGAAAGDQLTGWENLLGLALLKLGRFTEAGATFERCLARQPDDADAHLGQGHARLRLGDYAGAAAASRAAIALRYDYPLAHFNLGIALARTGENDRATRHMETVLHLLAAARHGERNENGRGLALHARRVLAVLRQRAAKAVTQN